MLGRPGPRTLVLLTAAATAGLCMGNILYCIAVMV
jgi:hypothetical protein